MLWCCMCGRNFAGLCGVLLFFISMSEKMRLDPMYLSGFLLVRLISGLSDSDKEVEEDYLVISRNWYPSGIYYPTTGGRASG